MPTTPPTPPPYDLWLDYCFTSAQIEFSSEGPMDPDFEISDPLVVADYLTRFFENPAAIADTYTDEQIAQGLWFIFGVGSNYIHSAAKPVVPLENRLRWLRGVSTLYRNLLFWVCDNHGLDRDQNHTNSKPLDIAIYMIWDMNQLQDVIRIPELVDIGFAVLADILSLRSYTCRMSALHGLGHQAHKYPDRVAAIIAQFLEKADDAPTALVNYAGAACTGTVQ